jgi:hypothetical protein
MAGPGRARVKSSDFVHLRDGLVDLADALALFLRRCGNFTHDVVTRLIS